MQGLVFLEIVDLEQICRLLQSRGPLRANAVLARDAEPVDKTLIDLHHCYRPTFNGPSFVKDVAPRSTPDLDRFGRPILSTTSDVFDLHTDESFAREPAGMVAMLCVRPAERGGDTLLGLVEPAIADLAPDDVLLLTEAVYPSRIGAVPVLNYVHDHWEVRFNRVEMERAAAAGVAAAVGGPHMLALEAFEKSVRRRSVALVLQSGDLLVLNNRTTLHGRSAFDEGSGRLLKRLRA